MRNFRVSDGEGQSSDPDDQLGLVPEGGHFLPKENEASDAVSKALDKLKPAMSKLTFGAFVGYCSGVAAKKVGKAVAAAIGFGFIALQGIAYTGYIDVDWQKVKDDAVKTIDTVSSLQGNKMERILLIATSALVPDPHPVGFCIFLALHEIMKLICNVGF
uniref:FUN14 domain-containing protein n=1 Tax=Odontella aurita TaxID=265563 RepID=A0A7S4IM08_9STRA|mmetsp:Transcript_27011/g.79813  ORF Transcript_27011/g.79813 Transcript_27011/m.79813 type:complete len:160 (+) Transcript_27011:183-662(+)